ncbi:MAG: phosphoribosylformylglycinamidine cyclo-ligase [Ktedonobacterales bacterium]|nr:phosphoribosylformylglycinamidine cyclo-ligase [Ktedonobacterales bacterium]
MNDFSPPPSGAYAASGVDIDAMNRAKRLIGESVASTRRPEVLADVGAFGGLFALAPLGMRDPVLVTSIDGVGTKLKVAFALDRHGSVGADLVAHCVNDILTTGARPLMFLDYLALADLAPATIALIVAGVAEGCATAGCALIGGETAQMPGFYPAGEYDLAGTIIGIVERDAIITGKTVAAGDVVIGLPAVGLHTNGYSLARQIFAADDWSVVVPELGLSLGDALLLPHPSYLAPVRRVLDEPALAGAVTGMAHITGGGLLENLPRVLPDGLGIDLDARRWDVLPIFHLLQQRGNVSWDEMARVFNLGIGYCMIVRADRQNAVLDALNEGGILGRVVGSVVPRDGEPRVQLEGLPE